MTLVLEWDFGPRVAIVYYISCNVTLMLRLLLRVCDELSDAVGPVVRSGSRSDTGKIQVNLQGLLLPTSADVRKWSSEAKIDVVLTLKRRSG